MKTKNLRPAAKSAVTISPKARVQKSLPGANCMRSNNPKGFFIWPQSLAHLKGKIRTIGFGKTPALAWADAANNLKSPPPIEELKKHLAPSVSDTEKALNYYKAAVLKIRPDFVPDQILIITNVQSDRPAFTPDDRLCIVFSGMHSCESNQYGAISVRAANGQMLGIKPDEFEIIAWKPNPHE